ncbi:hypothetical protein BDZ89DRAFT_372671 [Hymenopellis radicata]|nr:hypothetical protein BDZ89DRAFT_372671 [Hymenopellis radicata]
MDDLASMLGGGIRLISMNGESDPSEEEEQKPEEHEKQAEVTSSFKPIPIKRRTPAPSFAVTSRPQHKSAVSLADTRQRSASLVPTGSPAPALPPVPSPPMMKPRQSPTSASASISSGASSTSASTVSSRTSTSPAPVAASPVAPRRMPVGTPISQRSAMKQPMVAPKPRATSTGPSLTLDAPRQRPTLTGPSSASDPPRQRNSIVMPGSSSTVNAPRSQARPQPADNTIVPRPRSTSMMQLMPVKTFTSPASSIGDSSSGRQPLTPNDGSDIASSATGHSKQRSVSFENNGKDKQKKELERRRNEAKASIEVCFSIVVECGDSSV